MANPNEIEHHHLFNREWIRNGFPKDWVGDTPKFITRASYLCESVDTREQGEGKVIVASLISIISPKLVAGKALAYRLTTGTKKQKVSVGGGASFAYILLFHDLYDRHNMFAIFLDKRSKFQHLFGYEKVTDLVTIGDVFAIVEAQGTRDTLGGVIPTLQEPRLIVGLHSSLDWPSTPIIKSNDPSRQVCFRTTHQEISIQRATLITGPFGITCPNTTCDRQNIQCKGCYGAKLTAHPIVLRCTVIIENAVTWDMDTKIAIFSDFQSYRFSKLFFEDLNEMSSLEKPGQGIYCDNYRARINNMVRYINANGGWTIQGWHRRGQQGADPDDLILSETTQGHLILLVPTDTRIIYRPDYKAMLIRSPDRETTTTQNSQQETPVRPSSIANQRIRHVRSSSNSSSTTSSSSTH